MIENNIIQSLGAGSGIDSNSLVEQLVEIERAAPQERIDDKKELLDAQISDYGSFKSAISTLQTAVQTLTDEEGLYSKSASFTDSDALVPTDLGTDTQTGTYAFVVSSLAQSQSLSSVEFNDPTDAVGEGTLTLSFGDWDAGLSSFEQNTAKEQASITVDSSNNSLNGLRDTINDADIGVQASIVNNGSGFVLLLTAESGEDNEISITVSEDTPDGDPTTGLSRFDFNTNTDGQQLTQDQVGKDAALTVNGLAVTRTTNTISDVVQGLTLDLLKEAPTETITVTVSDDKAFAEQTVRDFVDAYNAYLAEIEPFFDTDEETGNRGSLFSDALAKSVSTQFRSLIASTIPGLSDTNYTALTNLGIRTELDGTLTINEDDFSEAFDNNFDDVQKLLAPYASTTGTGIDVNSWGTQTQAGTYDVAVTTTPVQASLALSDSTIGSSIATDLNGSGLATTGKTYSFTFTINGNESASVSVPTGSGISYDSGDALANAIQSAINADETLQSNNAAVTVSYESGSGNYFSFTSAKFGTSSSVSIVSASADAITDLGIQLGAGVTTSGIDAAGTIDGEVAFGLGNVLRPPLGSNAEGLNLIIGANASSSSTVSFSRGFSGELDTLIEQLLETNGLFDQREDNIDSDLDSLQTNQERLDRRMSAYQERLMQQFIAMENILNGLNTSGGFLDNLINTLPFTSSRE